VHNERTGSFSCRNTMLLLWHHDPAPCVCCTGQAVSSGFEESCCTGGLAHNKFAGTCRSRSTEGLCCCRKNSPCALMPLCRLVIALSFCFHAGLLYLQMIIWRTSCSCFMLTVLRLCDKEEVLCNLQLHNEASVQQNKNCLYYRACV